MVCQIAGSHNNKDNKASARNRESVLSVARESVQPVKASVPNKASAPRVVRESARQARVVREAWDVLNVVSNFNVVTSASHSKNNSAQNSTRTTVPGA